MTRRVRASKRRAYLLTTVWGHARSQGAMFTHVCMFLGETLAGRRKANQCGTNLGDVTDHKALRQRGANGAPRQLRDKLADGEPVALPDLVQQREGVKLHDRALRVDSLLHFVTPAADDLGVDLPGEGDPRGGGKEKTKKRQKERRDEKS